VSSQWSTFEQFFDGDASMKIAFYATAVVTTRAMKKTKRKFRGKINKIRAPTFPDGMRIN
jgi:hypothetical protein